MIDTHCHLHDKAFDADRAAVIDRMREAGVRTGITVGCDLADTRRAFDIAAEYALWASAGIHPHEAKDAPADIADAFDAFLRHRKIVAIGETGLDYYYTHSSPEDQQRVLRAQIAIARDARLPLIFHHRDAFDDFVAILRQEWRPNMRGVVHCFTGDTQQATILTQEFGLFLGAGGILTFKNAQSIRDAMAAVGLDRILLETDCPYLAPVPYRGKRNEPAFMTATAEKLCELFGMSLEKIGDRTTANACSLFAMEP